MDDFERYLSGTDDLELWGCTTPGLFLEEGQGNLFPLDMASAPAGMSLASEASTSTAEPSMRANPLSVPGRAGRHTLASTCVSVPEFAALDSLQSPGPGALGMASQSVLSSGDAAALCAASWGGPLQASANAVAARALAIPRAFNNAGPAAPQLRDFPRASPLGPMLASAPPDHWPASAPCGPMDGNGAGPSEPAAFGDYLGVAAQSSAVLPRPQSFATSGGFQVAATAATGFAPLDSLGWNGAACAGTPPEFRGDADVFPKIEIPDKHAAQDRGRPAPSAGLLSAQLGGGAGCLDTGASATRTAPPALTKHVSEPLMLLPASLAGESGGSAVPIPPAKAGGRRRRGMPHSDSCTSLPNMAPTLSADGTRAARRRGVNANGAPLLQSGDADGPLSDRLRRTARGRSMRRGAVAESPTLKRTSGLAAALRIDPEKLDALAARTKAIGMLTPEERAAKILRYKDKRTRRNFDRRITYRCRKSLADTRPRVGGRFARDTDERAVPPNLTQKAMKMAITNTGGSVDGSSSQLELAATTPPSAGLPRTDSSVQRLVAGLEATSIAPAAAT